jgi:glycosyltransferase involved in cell wall biosynthesis
MGGGENGATVTFCATDVYVERKEIDGITVLGWTLRSLLWAILRHPLHFLRLQARLTRACRIYSEPVVRTSLKAHLLRSIIVRLQPDYVHLHGCHSVIFLASGIVEAGLTVVTIHGIFGAKGPKRLALMEAALTQERLKLMVFVSSDVKKDWEINFGAPLAPSAVVLNAYDSLSFYAPQTPPQMKGGVKKTYHLMTVGNVSENKGQLRVVDALIQLSALGVPYDIRYTMVGESMPIGFADRILKRASDGGVSVDYHHYLSPKDIRTLLWSADFMILASENEGFGLVFLESIACGTPVVLPRTLPICHEAELISSHNAFLLQSHKVDAILAFLRELPEQRFVDADVAASCSGFTWKTAATQYLELLKD